MSGGRTSVDKQSVLDVGILGIADIDKATRGITRRRGRRLDRPIVMVDLAAIVEESAAQMRQETFNPIKFPEDAELLESVREHGVLEPIMVVRISELGDYSRYRTVFGNRRVAASRSADLDTIPAIIARKDDDLNLLTLAENTGGRGLTPYEKALGLARLKGDNPELSLRDLARRTGIHFTTVSNLLRAYQDAPPVLRGLFAEGMAPRAIVELQPVFTGLDQEEQRALAPSIEGIGLKTAIAIKQMVEDGIRTATAIETVLGSMGSGNGAEKKGSGTNAVHSKGRKKNKKASKLPRLDDEAKINAIARYTGASNTKVKHLIQIAIPIGAGMEALTFACLYTAKGGKESKAVQIAMGIEKKKRIACLIRRHLDLVAKARNMVGAVEHEDQKQFLSIIFFGG